MHSSVHEYIEDTITAAHVEGRRVLEVGSLDVNGSVRPHIEAFRPAEYLGIDLRDGPCVDKVADAMNLIDEVGAGWDLIVNCEMLEHVQDWRRCMIQMASALNPGGRLIITTRSPGFPYHPEPEDHWRYTCEDMFNILSALGLGVTDLRTDPLTTHVGVFACAYRYNDTPIPDDCLAQVRVHLADHPQMSRALTQHPGHEKTTWSGGTEPVNAPEGLPRRLSSVYDERPRGADGEVIAPYLEKVIETNRDRIEDSVRKGEEQLRSGAHIPTLDEIAANHDG